MLYKSPGQLAGTFLLLAIGVLCRALIVNFNTEQLGATNISISKGELKDLGWIVRSIICLSRFIRFEEFIPDVGIKTKIMINIKVMAMMK